MKTSSIIFINIFNNKTQEFKSVLEASENTGITAHFIQKLLKTEIADEKGNLFIREVLNMDPDTKRELRNKYMREYKKNMQNKEKDEKILCKFDLEMKQMEKEVSIYKEEISILKEESDKAQIRNKIKGDIDNYYSL